MWDKAEVQKEIHVCNLYYQLSEKGACRLTYSLVLKNKINFMKYHSTGVKKLFHYALLSCLRKSTYRPVAAYASVHCLDVKSVHILEWSYFLLGHTWTDWQFLSILMRSVWWKDQTFPLLQHYMWKQRDQIEFLDGYWLAGLSYDCHSGTT